MSIEQALEELVADCELVNRRSLDKNGVGLIDITVIARARAALREPVAEAFIVKHYSEDERPSVKGNGFDGLMIGEDREEAERFIAFVNARIVKQAVPIDMVLHCPACGLQHIDRPERFDISAPEEEVWLNPPHRSHLCLNPTCNHIWRPADVCTNGVAAVMTKGKDDSPIKDKS